MPEIPPDVRRLQKGKVVMCVEAKQILALLDTRATLSVMSESLRRCLRKVLSPSLHRTVTGIAGKCLEILG